MADLYAVSVDLGDGTAKTYFFDRSVAESMINQGYRVATQAEISKKAAGLANDPALGYYRQVLARHVPTPAETAAKVAGAKRDMGGWIDRYNVAAARAQPFLEKVGASSGNLVTGELVGNRKLTQQEMWNWQGMVAEVNKAAGQAQWYAAEAGLSEYPDRGQAAIRSGTAVSQDKAAWKTQEVEPLVWANFLSPDGKSRVTAYEGSGQYRTLVGMGWKVASTQKGQTKAEKADSAARVAAVATARQHNTGKGGFRPDVGIGQLKSSEIKEVIAESSRDFKAGAEEVAREVVDGAVEEGKSVMGGGMRASGWYPITRPVSSSRRVEGLPQSHGRPRMSSAKGVR